MWILTQKYTNNQKEIPVPQQIILDTNHYLLNDKFERL